MTSASFAWVLQANAATLMAGCKTTQQPLCLGDLAKVPGSLNSWVYALVYNIQVADDLIVRQLVLADIVTTAYQRRGEPYLPLVQIHLLTVGYSIGADFFYGIPPRPPAILSSLVLCSSPELQTFSAKVDYLQFILSQTSLPSQVLNELLINHLQQAAAARSDEDGRQFLLSAGRKLAFLLHYNPTRLDSILKRISPENGKSV